MISFEPDELKIGNLKSKIKSGCLARIRTYDGPVENEALARADAQIDALKLGHSAELIEILKAWAELPDALKQGVLAIVRSIKKGTK